MNAKTVGAVAVVLAAGAIVGVKAARQRPAEAAVTARAAIPSVVLVADPREADSECGCGQFIRRVRDAKTRGVNVQEIGPADPAAARYGVTVAPTVLILDADGRVVARREGEASDALAAISADLAALEGQKR
jgi:hypothetical protein